MHEPDIVQCDADVGDTSTRRIEKEEVAHSDIAARDLAPHLRLCFGCSRKLDSNLHKHALHKRRTINSTPRFTSIPIGSSEPIVNGKKQLSITGAGFTLRGDLLNDGPIFSHILCVPILAGSPRRRHTARSQEECHSTCRCQVKQCRLWGSHHSSEDRDESYCNSFSFVDATLALIFTGYEKMDGSSWFICSSSPVFIE